MPADLTGTYLTLDDGRPAVRFSRTYDHPVERVWTFVTDPDELARWFPSRAEFDLRPGGRFYTVMQGPDGEGFPNTGCYLEVLPNERLVWTGALGPGFRPVDHPSDVPVFTAIIAIEPAEGGSKYTAIAMHRDPESTAKHKEMGFHEGWGAALDQLVELAQTI